MLILRRRAGETILIGEDIKITVMDVYEGGVRLAIDAPKSVPVLRSELLLAAKANQDAAAKEPERPKELLDLLGTVPDGKKQKL
jgi:carbon storage regulator